MRTRRMGAGLELPVIGLGCMVMPGFYGPGDEAESIATLHRAAEIGVTHLDTSDMYGAGKNEELIGRAIAGRRDRYLIASKFGNTRTADGKPSVNGRPDYVMQACEASLKRLGVDEIDLYYQHRVDPTVPIEDTVGAMTRLVEQGKIRFLGLSEAAPETIRRAQAVHPIAALQTEYSLWSRDAEQHVLPLTAELGIGYVAYAPLGRGMLGGDVSGAGSIGEGDRRREHPRFQGENLKHNLGLVDRLRSIADTRGHNPAQIALAWVLAKAEHIVAIPGTRRVTHLETNAAAADIALTADEMTALDAIFPPGAAHGDRYPAAQLAMLHR